MSEKISCIIVDDEPAALNQLVRYAEKTPFLQVEGTYNSALEVLEHLQKNAAPQLIFLDIQMPELSGMELAKNLPAHTAVIFTTAFDKYAVEGYKVNAVDYLLKPIAYAEFLAAANKAKDRLMRSVVSSREGVDAKRQEDDYIFIKSEYRQLKINLSSILYIEGLKDYVKIWLTTEASPVLSLMSLKRLEEQLPPDRFMRIHRSFIIALDKIDQVERNQVIIKTQRITVAEQYRERFNAFLDKRSL